MECVELYLLVEPGELVMLGRRRSAFVVIEVALKFEVMKCQTANCTFKHVLVE